MSIEGVRRADAKVFSHRRRSLSHTLRCEHFGNKNQTRRIRGVNQAEDVGMDKSWVMTIISEYYLNSGLLPRFRTAPLHFDLRDEDK